MQFLQHKDEEVPYLSWFLVIINILFQQTKEKRNNEPTHLLSQTLKSYFLYCLLEKALWITLMAVEHRED